MEEDCCQRVVSQLCGALTHLHSLGFVHRDLKPENVFLCDSACRWVKLGDFGMVSVKDIWCLTVIFLLYFFLTLLKTTFNMYDKGKS